MIQLVHDIDFIFYFILKRAMSIASDAFFPKKATFEANLHYLHVFTCSNQSQGSCSGRGQG